MEIVEKKPSELIPYANNSRTHSDGQVAQICASIREYGFTNPILIDEEGTIIAGHGRAKAAMRLGMESVPCIVLRGLTKAQKKAYVIADNKMALNAGWDEEKLRLELEGLKELDFDLSLTGFSEEEMKDLLDPDGEPEVPDGADDAPEPEAEAVSKPGDVWILGGHRLMCGDSTDPRDVERLMGGESADLLFTDPPYNVDVESADGKKIENDCMSEPAFAEFLSKAFKNASEAMRPGADFLVWHSDSHRVTFEEAMDSAGLRQRQTVIWVKNGFTFGRQDFKWMHEPCLYGWKDGAAHYFKPEFNHPTVEEDGAPNPAKMPKAELVELAKRLIEEASGVGTVMREDKPQKADLHPTMKPVALCSRLIRLTSKKGDLVLDPFGGSGSTLIACELLGRRCLSMEYDPRYADVIVRRWEKLTGKKASREENDGKRGE